MRDSATVRRDARMWELVTSMEAAKIAVEGMKAENVKRAMAGDVPAYTTAAFNDKVLVMLGIAKQLSEV